MEEDLVASLGEEAVPPWLVKIHRTARGKPPTLTEWAIIIYTAGYVWQEFVELVTQGVVPYVSDMWNIVDFVNNCFYVAWIFLRSWSWLEVWVEERSTGLVGVISQIPREQWSSMDPMLLSEGMFGAANILSFLKLVHIFSVHPHLGPLQISLGRMVFDIIKFFFIYTLVLFAFGCGLNQLLWYYSHQDRDRCASGHLAGVSALEQDHSCDVWRRFNNLFETSQSLFWASFGLVDLKNFELLGIKEFTRFWALLTFGCYSVINVVVLLNLLIAMMSNSYQRISEQSDVEWKFARSKLWISYFSPTDTPTIPPPFNIVPHFGRCCVALTRRIRAGFTADNVKGNINEQLHENIVRCLVRRYVTREQRRAEEIGSVTGDDVNEIKQDIAGFRYELIDILKTNGMRVMSKDSVFGKKEKARERRLLKGFNIGTVDRMFEKQSMNDPHRGSIPPVGGEGVLGPGPRGSILVGGHELGGGGRRKHSKRDSHTPDSGAADFSERRRSSIISQISSHGGSMKRRLAAQSRWMTAIALVTKDKHDPIGSSRSGSRSASRHESLADLRRQVMAEVDDFEMTDKDTAALIPVEEKDQSSSKASSPKLPTGALKKTLVSKFQAAGSGSGGGGGGLSGGSSSGSLDGRSGGGGGSGRGSPKGSVSFQFDPKIDSKGSAKEISTSPNKSLIENEEEKENRRPSPISMATIQEKSESGPKHQDSGPNGSGGGSGGGQDNLGHQGDDQVATMPGPSGQEILPLRPDSSGGSLGSCELSESSGLAAALKPPAPMKENSEDLIGDQTPTPYSSPIKSEASMIEDKIPELPEDEDFSEKSDVTKVFKPPKLPPVPPVITAPILRQKSSGDKQLELQTIKLNPVKAMLAELEEKQKQFKTSPDPSRSADPAPLASHPLFALRKMTSAPLPPAPPPPPPPQPHLGPRTSSYDPAPTPAPRSGGGPTIIEPIQESEEVSIGSGAGQQEDQRNLSVDLVDEDRLSSAWDFEEHSLGVSSYQYQPGDALSENESQDEEEDDETEPEEEAGPKPPLFKVEPLNPSKGWI